MQPSEDQETKGHHRSDIRCDIDIQTFLSLYVQPRPPISQEGPHILVNISHLLCLNLGVLKVLRLWKTEPGQM